MYQWFTGVMKMKGPMGTEAEIIRNRRIELGLSQIEVAVSAGLILQQYQRFEYGYQKLSNANMITALRICAVLKLDPYEFVTDFENLSTDDK